MTAADDSPAAIRLRALRYRAHHRGFKEADLILGSFADAHLPGMSPAELDAFEALLAVADQELYGYLLDRAPPPAGIDAELLARLKRHRPPLP